MAFTPQFLDELRARASVADLVGKRVKLTRKGRDYTGLCPFHKEKSPSFFVFEDHYHCFGCQAHGSALDFLIETEGLSFPEAVVRLAATVGLDVPDDTPEEREKQKKRIGLYDVVEAAAVYFQSMLKKPEAKHARDYLTQRGLDGAVIDRFRLGYAPDGRGGLSKELLRQGIEVKQMLEAGLLVQPEGQSREPYDRFRGRLMFPISDRGGRAIAFGARTLSDNGPKYLNSPETPLFHKGRTLYALDQSIQMARRQDKLVVTEGYMDVIALFQAGLEYAVAPLGTAITEDQISMLWRVVREPVLCFDGDHAGWSAAGKAAERALPLIKPGFGLRFATLPDGEDPDSLIQKGGAPAFNKVLEQAQPLSEILWQRETGGEPPRTPEAKAALQDKFQTLTRLIQDPTVRSHFTNAFRDRLSPAGSTAGGYGGKGKNWRKSKSRGWQPSISLPADAGPKAHVESELLRQRILITTLINHIELYDAHSEEIGLMVFSEPALDKLRQEVLNTLPGNIILDSKQLQTHLRNSGFSGLLDELLGSAVYNHAFFAKPDIELDVAQAGWIETVRQLRNKDVQAEILEAERHFSTAATDEDGWLRLQALKRAEFADQEDDIEFK